MVNNISDWRYMMKKTFNIIFMMILLLPIVFSGYEFMSQKDVDGILKNVTRYEKPEFHIRKFWDGVYQNDYDTYYSNEYSGRDFLVKTYNQVRYTLFDLTNNIIVGENKDLFEETYINEYMISKEKFDFGDDKKKQQLSEYVKKLEYISEQMKKQEKQLIFVISPNKCDYKAEDIPSVYIRKDSVRGIDYMRELLANSSVCYLDSYVVIDEAAELKRYPIFYRSGTHWSRLVEQTVSKEILRLIEEQFQTEIKKMKLKDVEESSEGFWRDTDLYQMLNIWEKNHETYYEYNVETVIPENYKELNILIQGGSFSEGFLKDFTDNQIVEDINLIWYNCFILDKKWSVSEISNANDSESMLSDWSALDLQHYVDNANVIILEINAEHIYAMSNGFVDLLYEYFITEG